MLGIYWKDLEGVRSQRWKDLCSRKILGSPASFPKMSTNRSDTPLMTCAKHGVPAPCEDPTKNYSVSVELKNCSHILKNLQYKCQTIKINQKNMILPPFASVTSTTICKCHLIYISISIPQRSITITPDSKTPVDDQ